MGELIKKLSNGTIIEYDRGSFDNWCVYITKPNETRFAPKDIEYFTFFQNIASELNPQNVYDSFVSIYDLTNNEIETPVLRQIVTLSESMGNYAEEYEMWMTVVYAGMIAEQNKRFTKLGKRVKRLGMHQVILENVAPNTAAFFSRGMGWREIDQHCTNRGF
ncbi:DUF7004 family protein [Candidatus Neomarinimicrobiota bacterium]